MDKKADNIKKCFIITPIGEEGSEIRRKADGVIETAIKPLLEKFKFTDVVAAHHIAAPGSINNQVLSRVVNDDLVIANLTGLNANVMYELAVRHATMKPIIHICDKNTSLPFDIKDQRTIFYTDDMLGVKELAEALQKALEACEGGKLNKDNPIYSAVERKIYEDIIINEPNKNIEHYMLSRLDSIEYKLSTISNANINSRYGLNEELIRTNPSRILLALTKNLHDLKDIEEERIKLENFTVKEEFSALDTLRYIGNNKAEFTTKARGNELKKLIENFSKLEGWEVIGMENMSRNA